MDQVKFVKDRLKTDHITSYFLKAAFHTFHLIHSWVLCLVLFTYYSHSLTTLQKILWSSLCGRFYSKIFNGVYPLTFFSESSLIRGFLRFLKRLKLIRKISAEVLVSNRDEVERFIMVVAGEKKASAQYTIAACALITNDSWNKVARRNSG